MSLAFQAGGLATLTSNDLPSAVRNDMDAGQLLAIRSGAARGKVAENILADSAAIGNWTMAVNLANAKAVRGAGGVEVLRKLQSCADSGENPWTFSKETEFLFAAAESVKKSKIRGHSRQIAVNADGSKAELLADATTTSSGREGGGPAPFITPLNINSFTSWLKLSNAPQIGQQTMPVIYVDGVGKAEETASMKAVQTSGSTPKHHQAPVRVIAYMSDTDYLREAEAAFSVTGQGYSLPAVNNSLAMRAMRARMTQVAINGDSAIGWKGALSTGSVGAGSDIDKSSVNVTSATAPDVHAAIVAALNQPHDAAGDDADEALDCVVFGPQVWARLGEVSSGKTYMAMLMEHFAARGIPATNWFVSNDLKNATASRNYMLVTRKAPSVNQPFFMVGESPTVLTYPFGSASQTFYLNACAGFWAPFAWSMAVVQFAYTP